MLPSLRYAFLMSSTEASYSRRQRLLPEVKSYKQTYTRQFQVRIVVAFYVGLHHDPGKAVASQRRGVGVVRCDAIPSRPCVTVRIDKTSMRVVVRSQAMR